VEGTTVNNVSQFTICLYKTYYHNKAKHHVSLLITTSPSVKGTDGYPHMPILHPGCGPHARRFIWFWAFGRAKFTNICDSLPWTLMNHCAKFDAASFILGREICNHTNKQRTDSKRYIHALPISMCTDNNNWFFLFQSNVPILHHLEYSVLPTLWYTAYTYTCI